MNKKTISITALAIFLAGGLGTAVGSAGATPVPVPAPKTITKTVTVTIPGPERIVNKNVEVIKEVTPEACIDALKISARVFEAVGVEHTAFSEAATQAQNDGDIAGFVHTLTGAMKDMTTVVDESTGPMGVAAAGCRQE